MHDTQSTTNPVAGRAAPPTPSDLALINGFSGKHHFLSNFHEHPLVWDHQLYPSGEAAFHAGKTIDPRLRAWIAAARTPGEAKRRGRQVPLRPHWDDDQRHAVMREVIAAKFADPELRARLLATGTALLVERNTWHDLGLLWLLA